ncbi:MAG: hypothetical protein QOD57_5569 [Actinomycetota bacterium]|jgi:hypothetical protein|nr:hypothetical protein [Actinomycetota bacterium]MDQ1507842.1 hypothetical protein [Actinomycetota bacterium]
MRRILFVVALLAALVPTAGQSASAQVAALAPFSGYSTGTAVHAGALESGTTRLVDSELAFSGANVNSGGLGAALPNEMAQAYQSVAKAGDKSAGRGSGLEIGVATTVPNVANANQINPGSTVQAFAPASTALLTKEFIPVALDPIVNATTLRGQAQAVYSDSVCVLGQPISSGLGYAANANLVNTGSPLASKLATNTGTNAVNQSKSFTYLTPNGDGTYGLVTESHQILAPITLIPGIAPLPDVLSVEFAGEWVLRSTATGKPGGAKVDYAPGGDPTSTTKVLTIKAAGLVVQSFTTQQFLTQKGLPIVIPGVAEIVIGEAPRAIGGATGSTPVMAANGTETATAVDVLRIKTLAGLAGITDLRVGHMESRATVPVGGIQCGIPVKKTGTPASVVAGKDQIVSYTITVPADVEAFKAIACDIVNIKVVDVTTAEPGVKFNIVSASSGGVISGGDTVTWPNLGKYTPGDAPIVLTVGLKVPSNSAAGKITDTATATAVLGNCKGNASANAASLTGLAKVEAAALTGSDAFSGTATTLADAAPVVSPAGQGATPVGGVQTGAGGMSHRSTRGVPIAAALGSFGLVGSLAARRRRRNG